MGFEALCALPEARARYICRPVWRICLSVTHSEAVRPMKTTSSRRDNAHEGSRTDVGIVKGALLVRATEVAPFSR